MAESTTGDLPNQVFDAVKKGEESALTAIHEFVDTVNDSVPEGPLAESRRKVVNSAFEMVGQLLQTQNNFIQAVMDTTTETLDSVVSTEKKDEA